MEYWKSWLFAHTGGSQMDFLSEKLKQLHTCFYVSCFSMTNFLPITVQSIGMLCQWSSFQIFGNHPEISRDNWTPNVCKTFEPIDFVLYVVRIRSYVQHWHTLPSSTSNTDLSYVYIVSHTLIMHVTQSVQWIISIHRYIII